MHVCDARVRRLQRREFSGLGIENGEVRAPALRVRADDAPRRDEGVGRHPEDPLRQAKLCLPLAERLDTSLAPAVEVPPARPVRDEVERAFWGPLWLEDGFSLAARDPLGVLGGSVSAEIADHELRTVPGHVRVVPRQPHEAPAIGAQAWRGVEVVARDEHALLPAFEVYADDLVYGLIPAVLLPYGDKAAAVPVNHHVRVSPAGLRRRKRCRFAAWDPAVDPLIREVREEDRAFVDGEVAATVLVNPRAGIEGLRRHVLDASVRRQLHDYVAPALAGAALQPVHVPAVDHYF